MRLILSMLFAAMVVGLANGNMFVDDRHVYSAENLKVGLFKDTSNF